MSLFNQTCLNERLLPNYTRIHTHLPPITKTIQVRRTRHAGHCWRSRDELISDVLLWTSTYGWAKAGWPARTCMQQLCEDMGCSPEDLPEAMNDKEKWREKVRDICASSTTWSYIKMPGSDEINRNISFVIYVFDCSQLVLTLGHCQKKKLLWRKFL